MAAYAAIWMSNAMTSVAVSIRPIAGRIRRSGTTNGDVISFYELIPLYAEEMDLKLNKGAEELERRFDRKNIGYVLDVTRPNVAESKSWFGR